MGLRVQSLAFLSELRIWRCRELWCSHRCSSDPALLWLWCRLAATAPIRPLAWEPPYAAGSGPRKAKRQKQNKTKVPLKDVSRPLHQIAMAGFISFG